MRIIIKGIGVVGALAAAAAGAVLAFRKWGEDEEESRTPPPEPARPEPKKEAPKAAEPEAAEPEPEAAEPEAAEPEAAEPEPAADPEPEPAAEEPAAASGPVTVDGVSFANAAAALAWVNEADEDALKNAGLKGRVPATILGNRPFASLEALSGTSGIGKKTLETIADATA